MIVESTGNLLEADVDALVNTVNSVGVMGKGIALQFRQAYPENFDVYAKACKAGQVRPGRMLVFPTGMLSPKFIINFPTKRHWKGKSKMEDIEKGLIALLDVVRERRISSIAVPPLGCGNGGLDWSEVKERIITAFSRVPNVKVLLYPPHGAPPAEEMKVKTKRPNMTPARAALLSLFEAYGIPGYRLTLLEIEKLAYFLQEAGEALRLNFVKAQYGPYTETLHHVLQRLEGHFLRGYGDRSESASIRPLEGALEEARLALASQPETQERLAKVERLIHGFETPYGLELLASVHWIAKGSHRDATEIIEDVHQWNARKKQLFRPQHIHAALEQLKSEHWLQ